MKLTRIAVVSVFILFITSCSESKKSTGTAKVHLPEAYGEVGEIAMLSDDATYNQCQKEIHNVYQRSLPGMAGMEPYLKVNQCDETGITDYFKENFNLSIVYNQQKRNKYLSVLGEKLLQTLDDKIQRGESFFVAKDVFAQPQEVCFILGKDTGDLNIKLAKHKDKILELALETEKRCTKNIVIRGSAKEDAFYQNMMSRYGYAFRTPVNFNLSVRSDEFNGVNRSFGEKRSGLYIYEEDYKGDFQFSKEYIVKKRNEVLRNHLHGPDRKDSIPTYVGTDTINVELVSKEIKLNGYKAFETRGWWEMINDFFGGPFVSYTIYCPEINKVVTIEGNVFAPSKKKQDLLRTLEIAASTFEVKK